MDNMKNMKKIWFNSLSFLDNCTVNTIIIVVLLLYSSQIFDNINSFVGNFYNFSIVRLIVLLLIIYVSPKDTTIAILLAVSYLVSLNFMMINENFSHMTGENFSHMTGEDSSHMTGEDSSYIKERPNKQNRTRESFIPQDGNEHFFPMINKDNENNEQNDSDFNPMINRNKEKINNDSPKFHQDKVNDTKCGQLTPLANCSKESSNLTTNVCMDNYVPRFESISDVCSPTATFKDEFNAQGLNFPEGFDMTNVGSPLI